MQRSHHKLSWMVALAALVMSTALGCEDATRSTASVDQTRRALSSPEIDEDIVLAERVFELDDSQISELRIGADFIEIDAPVAADLMDLQPGDILLSELGDGFWRVIEATEVRSDRLVLTTRDAQLEEVVREGTFDFVFNPPDQHHATQRRAQQLRPEDARVEGVDPQRIDADEELGSLDLSTDLGSSSRADVSNALLSVDTTRGSLSFQPAIRLLLVVVDGQIHREHFRVSGWADFDVNWTVDAQDTSSLQHAVRLLPDDRQANQLAFRLLGRSFQIDPDLRLMYDVSATGQGRIDLGLDGEGYVLAGYDCSAGSSCVALRPEAANDPFAAGELHQWSEGEPTISMRTAFQAGVDLQTSGLGHGSATPLELTYQGHADVSPPFCPYTAKATAEGVATYDRTSLTNYTYELFDDESLFTGQNDCGVTLPPGADSDDPNNPDGQPCARDSDCPDEEMCMLGSNVCVTETPFSVTLKWSQSVDLNLRVETKTGEELSADTPTVSNGELTHVSVGGADCDDCLGQCDGGTAFDCANETPSQGTCPSHCEYTSETQGSCSGTRYSGCGGLDAAACMSASTCMMICNQAQTSCACHGILVESCQGLDENTCKGSYNCSWSSQTVEYCEGGRVRCSDLDQTSCTNSTNCDWQQPATGGTELPPFIEHAGFDPVTRGDPFRIWVSNISGLDDVEDTVSYTLLFRTEDGEYFEVRGEFEPDASSQSIFFDYDYLEQ